MNKIVVLYFIALILCALNCDAQTCTTAICTATDCTEPSVLAALPSAANSNATVTVNIPACSGGVAWTSGQVLSYTMNAAQTTLSIIGQGTGTGSDSLGNYTGYNDQTVIIDHTGAATSLFLVTSGANANLRISGLTLKDDSGTTPSSNGQWAFTGNTTNFRFDHNHFLDSGGVSNSTLFGIVYGNMFGVVDHNVFDLLDVTGVDQGIRVQADTSFGDTSASGNGSWSAPSPYGTNASLFFENNTFGQSISNDCAHGGRQVFRYNTFNNSSIQTHEMEGDARGCRYTELYKNLFNGVYPSGTQSFTVVGYRMGTGVVWGNAVTLYANLITFNNDRTNGHLFNIPPNGFGYCGTLGFYSGPSNWDGNTNSSGYPCVDQAGRGQSDVLQGAFPTKCDITTFPSGCSGYLGSWPHNKQEPVYEWLDNYTCSGCSGGAVIWNNNDSTTTFALNRDVFIYNGSFTGASGTGSGLLSSRPSTCTPLVAYWATDTNTLYQCGPSANQWNTYYIPYTYPHPLVTGGSSLAITTSSLPNGAVGTVYTTTTMAATGGTTPYTWSWTSNPAGLSMSTGGVITGNPTTAGMYSPVVTIMDSASHSAMKTFSITISGAPPPPTFSPATVLLLGEFF